MGTVRKRGKMWYAFWSDGTGRRRAKAVSPCKRDAEDFLARIEAEKRMGVVTGFKAAPFSDVAREYLEQVAVKRKPTTYDNVERIIRLRLNPYFGEMTCGAIAKKDCDAYLYRRLRSRSSANGTVRNEVATLAAIMEFAVRWGYAKENPTHGMEKPKRKKSDMGILTAPQLRKLIEGSDAKYSTIFAVAGLAGLRAGEIAGLQERDVDFEDHVIRVQRSVWRGRFTTPKTDNSARTVDMTPYVERALRGWLGSPLRAESKHALVFPNTLGEPQNMSNVREFVLYPTLRRLGLPRIRFHDLRHTYASLLIAQGEPLTYVRDMLGHASVRTTADIYGHLLYETRRNAAVKLDAQVFGPAEAQHPSSAEITARL